MPLWLTQEDVRALLTMPAAINAVEDALRRLSLGHAELPLRTNMPVPPHAGSLLTMPAYVGGSSMDALGVKLITVYLENPERHGLPAIQGILALFQAETGALVAVMEAGHLTGMRTGAAGGVAIRHLAREDALSLVLFGTGTQAPYQLEAALCERLIERVWIVSRDPARAHAFAQAMETRFGLEVRVPETVEQAVRDADILVTATSATDPLFDGRWIRPGTHINAIGAHLPHAREVDTVTVQRARVVVDQRQACLAEAGDLVVPLRAGSIRPDHISAELGEIVAGQKPGRTHPKEITLFKSVGLAIQDVAVAAEVVRMARIRGRGQEVPL